MVLLHCGMNYCVWQGYIRTFVVYTDVSPRRAPPPKQARILSPALPRQIVAPPPVPRRRPRSARQGVGRAWPAAGRHGHGAARHDAHLRPAERGGAAGVFGSLGREQPLLRGCRGSSSPLLIACVPNTPAAAAAAALASEKGGSRIFGGKKKEKQKAKKRLWSRTRTAALPIACAFQPAIFTQFN